MTDKAKELAEQSALQLWQAYCDKKMECERLQKVNKSLVELSEALNDALIEICSTNPNGRISRKHYQRIQDANAKIKEQA